jgi:hypothetical protein
VPDLPNYYGTTRADVPEAVHAAHTTKPGIHQPDGMDSSKAARLLNKLAKSLSKMRKTPTRKKKTK